MNYFFQIMKSGCSLWSAEIEKLKKTELDMMEYFCETPNNAEDKILRLETIYADIDTLVDKIETSIKVILSPTLLLIKYVKLLPHFTVNHI